MIVRAAMVATIILLLQQSLQRLSLLVIYSQVVLCYQYPTISNSDLPYLDIILMVAGIIRSTIVLISWEYFPQGMIEFVLILILLALLPFLSSSFAISSLDLHSALFAMHHRQEFLMTIQYRYITIIPATTLHYAIPFCLCFQLYYCPSQHYSYF